MRFLGILKWGVLIAVVALTISGCSKHVSDSVAIQGTWTGQQDGAKNIDPLKAVFSGNNLDVNGNDPNEWFKATFTLQEDASPKQISVIVTGCPVDELVGKTLTGTYDLDGNALTLTGYKSKNPALPEEFSMLGPDQVVLKFNKQ